MDTHKSFTEEEVKAAIGLPEGSVMGTFSGFFHGHSVTFLAIGREDEQGRTLVRPLAVMLESHDMPYVQGPSGEGLMDAVTGKPKFDPESKLDPDIRAGYL